MKKLSGFTLIEILIAITIFSIMAVAASTVLYTVFNARDQVTQHAVKLSQLQLSFLLIERDLTQIIDLPVKTPQKMESGVYGLTDAISFSRGGIINPLFKKHQSTLGRVNYQLQGKKLIRSQTPALNSNKPLSSQNTILFDDIDSLSFNYIDNNQQPNDQWYKKKLPIAIRITFKHKYWGQLSQIYVLSQSIQTHAPKKT